MAYLAGIKLSNTTTYKVDKADFEKVILTNYEMPEVWYFPNFNLSFNVASSTYWPSASWRGIWWTNAYLANNSSKKQLRNIVTGGNEPTSNDQTLLPEKVQWVGTSINLVDNIMGNFMGKMNEETDGRRASYLGGYFGGGFDVANALDFSLCNVSKVTNWNNYYGGRFYYTNSWSGGFVPGYIQMKDYGTWYNRYVQTKIDVFKDNNDNEYTNKHILNYKKINYYNLTNVSWQNILGWNRVWNQDNTLKNTGTTKGGGWSALEVNLPDATTKAWAASQGSNNAAVAWKALSNFGNIWSGDEGLTSTDMMVSVGVLNKTYDSTTIIQEKFEDNLSKTALLRLPNVYPIAPNLLNGLLIGYVKKDETFEWEPQLTGYWSRKADKTSTYHSTLWTTDEPGASTNDGSWCLEGCGYNNHIVKVDKFNVALATCYFDEGINLDTDATIDGANDGKYLKNDGQTTNYLTTDTSGKCKFKFKADKDCIVVAKWYPADQEIDTVTAKADDRYWNGTLDLTKCGTYKITADN